jgi:hypothetical protein
MHEAPHIDEEDEGGEVTTKHRAASATQKGPTDCFNTPCAEDVLQKRKF